MAVVKVMGHQAPPASARSTAATSAANIPISVTNELFASVTKASATLGLSGERTSLVLQALSQMASKGTVSMEELRGQLGESLPGALSLAAKGQGQGKRGMEQGGARHGTSGQCGFSR